MTTASWCGSAVLGQGQGGHPAPSRPSAKPQTHQHFGYTHRCTAFVSRPAALYRGHTSCSKASGKAATCSSSPCGPPLLSSQSCAPTWHCSKVRERVVCKKGSTCASVHRMSEARNHAGIPSGKSPAQTAAAPGPPLREHWKHTERSRTTHSPAPHQFELYQVLMSVRRRPSWPFRFTQGLSPWASSTWGRVWVGAWTGRLSTTA